MNLRGEPRTQMREQISLMPELHNIFIDWIL